MAPRVLDEKAPSLPSACLVRSDASTDLEAGVAPVGDPPRASNSSIADDNDGTGILPPSKHLTGHQLFYIVFLDGLGGMTLSAGANFAIAYAMYTTQRENLIANPIRLFQLPNTLAGDAAVTAIVQCILTWFVEASLVRRDLRTRSVQPLGPFLLREPEARSDSRWTVCLRWFFMIDGERTIITDIAQQALRGLIAAVFGFVLLWPMGVGILTTLGEKQGGDYIFADRWTPQFFKFVFGGLLGLFTTPLMAMFWLLKAGWKAEHAQSPRH